VPAASFCGLAGGATARVAIVDEGGAPAADGVTSGAADTSADVSVGVSIADIAGAATGFAIERSAGTLDGAVAGGATAVAVGAMPGLSSDERFRTGVASIPAIVAGIPTIDACGILGRIFFRLEGGDCAVVGSAPGDGDWPPAVDGD
jgi:hypothetical protein